MILTSVARSLAIPFSPSPLPTPEPIADILFCNPREGTVLHVLPPAPTVSTVDPRAGSVVIR